MKRGTIFLFGSAEKGAICEPLTLNSLTHLLDLLGHPPKDSEGLTYAIQALLFQQGVIYFRVTEEGFSHRDYMVGLKWLQKAPLQPHLSAICLPGVGDNEILQGATSICRLHQCLLLVSEKDLYDYLTVGK